ncbi:MAG: Thymidylate kinase [Mycoplasmataceae bacterium]|nr:MAG: Thymidylate kinase [Mycoplasmataceae bacterium]
MSLLISLEGIVGSGKTTLINNLKKSDELKLIVYSCQDIKMKEKFFHLIEKIESNKKANDLMFFSFFDELNQKIIKPILEKKKVLVISTYIDSLFLFLEKQKNLEINIVQEIVKKNIDLPLPDITFLLDIDPRKSQDRFKKKLNLESWDKIRNNYLKLKKLFPERIYIIDAEKNEKEILKEVEVIIKKCSSEKDNKENLPNFVRVIIRNEKGEILLVKDKKWGWNLPGGKVELDETPEFAACREIFEETNLVIKNTQKIGEEVVFFANLPPGKQHWVGHFFQTDEYSGEIKNKEDVADVQFFDIDSKEKRPENNCSSYKFYLEKIKKLNYS